MGGIHLEKRRVYAKNVLLIEDEPAIGNLCRRVLNDNGFEVDLMDNGQSAQQLVRQRNYDLLLVDLRTPAMDGIEFFNWLKTVKPDLASRVVFTTGDVIRNDTAGFLEITGLPYLPKPFTPDELMAAVSQALKTD